MQERLGYGVNGFKVLSVPKASRSKGKRSVRKRSVGKDGMCPIELLATVAGNLLQESKEFCFESKRNGKQIVDDDHALYMSQWGFLCLDASNSGSSSDSIKKRSLDEEKLFKVELCDQGSSDEGPLPFCGSSERKGCSHLGSNDRKLVGENDDASVVTKSGSSGQAHCVDNLALVDGSAPLCKDTSQEEECFENKSSPGSAESCQTKIGGEIDGQSDVDHHTSSGNLLASSPDLCCTLEPIEGDPKPPRLASSDSSDEAPRFLGHEPVRSSHGYQGSVKLVNRDYDDDDDDDEEEEDDGNSSDCTQPNNLDAFQTPFDRGHKNRKFFSSKQWKLSPTLLKDGGIPNNDVEILKPVYRNKKTAYKRQRTQRCSPSKKRKLLQQNSLSTSDGGVDSNYISNVSDKYASEEAAAIKQATEVSSLKGNGKSSLKSVGSNVKLSIKSFKVPELLIEMPETATLMSLKRAVMDAVTHIIGDGIRVGIFFQGKTIGDDTKTLLQSGIAHGNKQDDVGFILEPVSPHSPALSPDYHFSSVPSDATELLNTYDQASGDLDPIQEEITTVEPLNVDNNDLGADNQIPSSADHSIDKTVSDSKVLVAVPDASVEALAVVPINPRARRPELAQRRIRRPFTVTEVEALVDAVEKLGTGRWRDVKLSAFEDAKHRTYVDLKDKWKTLVHTASISPQQRRGEPVPQELLDRVLRTHSYWTRQQQVKQTAETRLLL